MISETSAVKGYEKSAPEVAKEMEAEMNAIKQVTVANNRAPEVHVPEPEDYDTDLEEESKWLIVLFYSYMPMSRKRFYCNDQKMIYTYVLVFIYFMILEESWEGSIDA